MSSRTALRQLFAQRSPAARACITSTDRRYRQWPRDRKVGVVVGDDDILCGIVRTVDPVTDVGGLGQRLEAVQKARRHVKVAKVVVVEQKRLLLAESRRVPPNVDQDVVNSAVRTTNELGFAASAAPVQAADHALNGAGLRVLHERRGGTRRFQIRVEDFRVERPREQAALVPDWLRYESQDAGEVGRLNEHLVMVP